MLGVAQPKLRRSMTASTSQNASASGEDRVSNTAWISEDMNPGGAGKLTQRIDNFLNLEATSFKHSESYQVGKQCFFLRFFETFSKITEARKAQGFFRPKLNELIVIVAA